MRDRNLQTAARLVLEPIFGASFLPCSYGFRPKRSAHQALESIRKEVDAGSRRVVEVEFRDFFGSLDPDLLLGLVASRISDRRVLRLIRKWMRVGVMEDGVTVSTATGVPQGGLCAAAHNAPNEQRWVMGSAGQPELVGAGVAIERCA